MVCFRSTLDEAYLIQMQMKDLPKIIYKYTNGKVDTGFSSLGEDFFKWLPTSGVSRKQQKLLDHVKVIKKAGKHVGNYERFNH